MSCNKAFNIKTVPMNAIWEGEESFCVNFRDQTVAALKGKYVIVYNAAGTKYAVWFDDGVVADPVVASATLVPVTITAGDSADDIAAAFVTAVNGLAAMGFTAEQYADDELVVKAIYVDTSKVQAPENGTAGLLLELTEVSTGGKIDLGLLDGDVSYEPTQETQDITAHQTGATILSQNITSVGATVSLTLKEYKPALYRAIYLAVGGKAAGAEVYGMGSGMIGKSLAQFAKRLILKPVGSGTDNSRNYTFWKAAPTLGSHTFSGENPTTLPLEFTAYIDDDKDENINVWAYGDIATLP